jgi:hypothetical protein
MIDHTSAPAATTDAAAPWWEGLDLPPLDEDTATMAVAYVATRRSTTASEAAPHPLESEDEKVVAAYLDAWLNV